MRTLYNAVKCVGICCLSLCFGTANAALTHQYTFNDGTANDSVGGANGTLMGGATVSDGQVHLSGAQTDYVNLPGPEIAINTYTDTTFEGWFTYDQAAGNWQRLFDFGQTQGGGGVNYIFYTPDGYEPPINDPAVHHVNRAAITNSPFGNNGHEDKANGGPPLTSSTQHYVAVVVDGKANGGEGTMSVYVDGVLNMSPPVGVNPVQLTYPPPRTRTPTVFPDFPFANISNFNAYLGASNFSADPNLNGAINEFNIYDTALDAATIAAHYQAGPIPEPSTFVLAAAALIGAMLFHRRTTGIRGVVIPANDRRWR